MAQVAGRVLPEVWPGEQPPRGRSLRSLSVQARASGKFSSEELDKLWREFLHHQEKVREYNILLETLSRAEGARGLGLPGGGPGSECSRTELGRGRGGCRALFLGLRLSQRDSVFSCVHVFR